MFQGLPEKPIYLFPLGGEMMGHTGDGTSRGRAESECAEFNILCKNPVETALQVP